MSGLKSRIQITLGRIAARLAPHLLREMEAGEQTGSNIRLKRWIAMAQTQAALAGGSSATISQTLMNNWRSESANSYYDQYTARFEKWFLGPHQAVVDEMVKLNAETPLRLMVEVGCGDGRVLDHCAERMPDIPDCVGVDINPAIIARNQEVYAEKPRLRFVAENAERWLAQNTGPGTLLFTYGGVLEYFSRESLEGIFRDMAGKPGSAVALVEPVAPDHDLEQGSQSFNFGQEHSFSHNYAALLTEAGLELRYQSETQLGGARWVMMLAQVPGG